MAEDRWITQEQLDGARLVLIVDADGLYEWTSATSAARTADALEDIAAKIRAELNAESRPPSE